MDLMSNIAGAILNGAAETGNAWIANYPVGVLALVIILIAIFVIDDVGDSISAGLYSVLVWGIGLVVIGAWRSEEAQWDFMAQADSAWVELANLSFLQFFVYLLIFTVLIGVLKFVKDLISG